ncbi:MAG: nucleotidyltransferase family protein [Candidatus Eisenbacteria bacterium]|nr:nucleotidyltransferase family protein [Candidatus Eisenbacteria bacterium]
MQFSSAILLAAGKSERFGGLKQGMVISGMPLVRKCAAALIDGGVDELIVVVGHMAEEVTALLGQGRWKIVINKEYEEGMGSSIRTGARYVSESSLAILVALSDLPYLTGETVRNIVVGFGKCGKGILAPAHLGRRGHPVCFSRKYLGELRRLGGDSGARELLDEHPEDLFLLEVGTDSIYSDIDTEAPDK